MKGAICDRNTQTCRTQLSGDQGWKRTVTQLPEPVLFLQVIMLEMGGSLVTRATSITHSVQTTHVHSKLSVDNKNILLQNNNARADVHFLKKMYSSVCVGRPRNNIITTSNIKQK
jgi:hypothetical protein